jgi:2-oxoglutarate ferredoxin oxidoreductase subunit alpha
VDLIMESFDLADLYTNPVMIIGDGMIGQMMEPVEFRPPEKKVKLPEKTWAANGCRGREPNIVRSLYLDPLRLEKNNREMAEKYKRMVKNEVRFEKYNVSKRNRVLIVAYGTTSRICKTAIDELKAKKISVGLLRPISLYPYPKEAVAKAAEGVENVLVVEMSMGQMVEDVELALLGRVPVSFFGRTGGVVPTPEEVMAAVEKLL